TTSRSRSRRRARSGSIWTPVSPYNRFTTDAQPCFARLAFARAEGGAVVPYLQGSGYCIRVPHSSRERTPTAAGLRRIRIHEDEALLHQRLLVVERHAVQVDEGLRINKYAHVAELKNAIAFARLRVEANVVAQT